MTRALLALLLFAASCDDAADLRGPCLGGMVRDPGPACTLPAAGFLGIDGFRADWMTPDLAGVLIPGSCCRLGDSGVTYGARTSDGHLVFFSNTLGTPGFSGHDLAYGLAFWRADLPADSPGNIDTLVLADGSGGIEVDINGLRVFGVEGQAALGQEGVEWRLPASALPYKGAAMVVGVTYERDASGTVSARDVGTASALICWDPSDADDPCRAE